MNGEDAPQLFYLALLFVLVGASLVGTQLPIGKALRMALVWVAIFGAAFILFSFRGEFSQFGQRLRAEATGAPMQIGSEIRIPMSNDGHFWVDARINGRNARFLVDSGASITTVSETAADSAGLVTGMRADTVNTANGTVAMKRSRAQQFAVGPIERNDISLNVNPADDTNVLGMNFLSSLESWRVDGNYLVLRG